MKRITPAFLALSFLLCGCSNAENSTETNQLPSGVHINVDSTIYYDTVSDFLDSDFCKAMQEEGFTTYLLSYDETRYEFSRMSSDAKFYVFHFLDTQTDSGISITIMYDSFYEEVSDFGVNAADTSGDIITTAEKDGQTYDVYISKVPYTPEDQYNIGYIPFPDYNVYISSNRATPEEVLEDFQAFTLVPAESIG